MWSTKRVSAAIRAEFLNPKIHLSSRLAGSKVRMSSMTCLTTFERYLESRLRTHRTGRQVLLLASGRERQDESLLKI